MGKSSDAKMVVTDYSLSIHFGVCKRVDSFLRVRVNEKVVWQGDSGPGVVRTSVNLPQLFGGPKKEGGVAGTIIFMTGEDTQRAPVEIASRVGLTPETCPAYRGYATIAFMPNEYVAPEVRTILGRFVLTPPPIPDGLSSIFGGTTVKHKGFMWGSNSTVIAQTVWVQVTWCPTTLGVTDSVIMLGGQRQANPAHMIYWAMTDEEYGMAAPSAMFDLTAFRAAAATLHSEGFGLSMSWNQQTTTETFVQEVCDHIQATVFQHPYTGLFTIKLIRDDYDLEDLKVFDKTNSKLLTFSRKGWGETVTQITATWTNPDNEQEETVTVQNQTLSDQQGGQTIDAGRNYYGIRNRDLAVTVAARDCRSASAPTAGGTLEVDRRSWTLVPGEVFILNYPPKAENVVCRVGKIKYGRIGTGKIIVSFYEDIFSLGAPPITDVPGTEHVDPSEDAQPMDAQYIWTLPYYITASPLYYQGPIRVLEYPSVMAGFLAFAASEDTRSFEVLQSEIDSAGVTSMVNGGTKDVIGLSTLAIALTPEAQSTIAPLATVSGRGPQIGSILVFGNGGSTSELGVLTAVSGDNWIVSRGVLDTVPQSWAIGTLVWYLNPGNRIIDEKELRAVGEVPEYKLLSQTSLDTLDPDDATTISTTMTERPHAPLRPADVKINGVSWGNVALGPSDNIVVTWKNRNRLVEDTQILSWTDASVAPEYRQRTLITVTNPAAGEAVLAQYTHLWTETTYTIMRSWFARYAQVRVTVSSERDGIASIQSRSFLVTGLDNTGSGSPPSPPAPPVAPPPIDSPNPVAFSATGGAAASATGAQSPIIVVSGIPDRSDVQNLVVRYRKVGDTNYNLAGKFDLNDPN